MRHLLGHGYADYDQNFPKGLSLERGGGSLNHFLFLAVGDCFTAGQKLSSELTVITKHREMLAVEVKGFDCNAGGAYNNQCALTLQDLVVTICTARFALNISVCSPSHCVYVLRMIPAINCDFFAKKHSLIGLSDENTLFPVRYKLNMYVLMHSNFSLLRFRTLMKFLELSACVILLWISGKAD